MMHALRQLMHSLRAYPGFAFALLMALIPWVALLLAAVLSTDPGVILSTERLLVAVETVIAALLHPAERAFFRSFRLARINWVMLALVGIAAVPLFAFAATNIGLQGTVTDDHAGMGHYGFMAAFSFTVIGVGVLASLRSDGWRLTAWVAGLLPALFGASSVMFPDASSSLGSVWAVAVIAWGVAFVATAELGRKRWARRCSVRGRRSFARQPHGTLDETRLGSSSATRARTTTASPGSSQSGSCSESRRMSRDTVHDSANTSWTSWWTFTERSSVHLNS
jgi:hypothetical protein